MYHLHIGPLFGFGRDRHELTFYFISPYNFHVLLNLTCMQVELLPHPTEQAQ